MIDDDGTYFWDLPRAERDRRHVRDGVRRANIPDKDRELVLNGSPTETDSIRVMRQFLESEEWMIALLGPPGRGKTTAASWYIAESLRRAYQSAPCDANASPGVHVFTSAPEIARTSRYDEKATTALETSRTLVIDDLGVEYDDRSGYTRCLFDALIDARYRNRLRTIVTSNLTLERFTERYGERIVDRFREAGRIVGVTGESLRGKH